MYDWQSQTDGKIWQVLMIHRVSPISQVWATCPSPCGRAGTKLSLNGTHAYSKIQTLNEIVRCDRPPDIDKIQDNHSLTNVNVSNLRGNKKRIRISIIIPRHILHSIHGLRKTATTNWTRASLTWTLSTSTKDSCPLLLSQHAWVRCIWWSS